MVSDSGCWFLSIVKIILNLYLFSNIISNNMFTLRVDDTGVVLLKTLCCCQLGCRPCRLW